jgi:hypothetical protein
VASQVEIVNQALIKLGAATITSLSENTKPANTMRTVYEVKRDAELAAEPWTFAITRTLLPASATPPAFGWQYSYPLPSDFLKMVEVGEDYVFYDIDNGPLFQIESDGDTGRLAVLTDDAGPLKIRYVRRVTTPGLFPPLFVEAFACRLAAETCEALTQSLSKREQAWGERKEAVSKAKRVNSIEQPPVRRPDSSWVKALTEN